MFTCRVERGQCTAVCGQQLHLDNQVTPLLLRVISHLSFSLYFSFLTVLENRLAEYFSFLTISENRLAENMAADMTVSKFRALQLATFSTTESN